MPEEPLRIAFLGGVPASIGGGGLELQRDRTATALQRRGHEVFQVAQISEARRFDVLHAFGSEVDVCHHLSHWRRNPAPLVVSPVVVAAPGTEERLLRQMARLPLLSLAPRQRALTLRRADLLVALTQHEARLLSSLAPDIPVDVVGNGVEPGQALQADGAKLGLRLPYVLLLGTVSARKRQAATITALGGTSFQPVVIGGFDGSSAERVAVERSVAAVGGRWLGELDDPAVIRGLVRGAAAMVHLSRAEGQSLAVLEAVAEGTPVVCSALPGNVELAQRYPRHVLLCDDIEGLPSAMAALPTQRQAVPDVPTWDDVAAKLEVHYRRLVAGPRP